MLRETMDFHGRKLTIETGRLAKQAHGSALVSLGDTTVLVTIVSGDPRPEADFVPLSVEYMERTYSAGRIPGGYFKREGKPTEVEILNSRIIDRPIRPLFPRGFRFETQVIAMVLSADKDNDPAIPGMIGASAALMFSEIPWDGPVAGLRVGYLDGGLVVNPSYEERENALLDLAVAISPLGLAMVEGESKEIGEDLLAEALAMAQEWAQPILDVQRKMAQALGVKKRQDMVPRADESMEKRIRELCWEKVCEALTHREKKPRRDALKEATQFALDTLEEEFPDSAGTIVSAVDELVRERLRQMLVSEGKRVDGRGLDDIRPISCEVGVLPRAHGSALFTRGETQVVVSATLGTPADEQRLDLLTGDVHRSFMLHYNFPPFSVGEIKPLRGPSRRDIGHGNLAQRAVSAVLPQKGDSFPYTLRVVSEVLESNGSSSMATVCGASLALMDAGVPVKCHVGGIAMGLVKEGEKVAILTDIVGDEDHCGDMDFKVAGTEDGVTAVQMDIKCSGLSKQILRMALEKARQARLYVIGKMKEVIEKPRDHYSPFAPKIIPLKVNPEKIKDVIGPGGRVVKGIQLETGAALEIHDDGTIIVSAPDEAQANKAVEMVRGLTDEAQVGKVYLGQVVKVTDFGAFVRILPGVEGLVHISELADHRVRRVEDVVREGDEILVKCVNIDRSGKIRLSRKEAMEEAKTQGNQGNKGQ
jgi:polyribonucleotide nucleotidyltransferase